MIFVQQTSAFMPYKLRKLIYLCVLQDGLQLLRYLESLPTILFIPGIRTSDGKVSSHFCRIVETFLDSLYHFVEVNTIFFMIV